MSAGANYQGGGGGFLCSFLKIEWSDPVCWGKCPDYGDLWVNFSLKCSFRIPKIIKPPNFSSWALLFVCFNWNVSGSGLVSRNLLCPEKLVVTRFVDPMVSWQRAFTLWTFTHSAFYFNAYFSFRWNLEPPCTDLLQFKHKCTYLFATNLKNKQYTRYVQS